MYTYMYIYGNISFVRVVELYLKTELYILCLRERMIYINIYTYFLYIHIYIYIYIRIHICIYMATSLLLGW